MNNSGQLYKENRSGLWRKYVLLAIIQINSVESMSYITLVSKYQEIFEILTQEIREITFY